MHLLAKRFARKKRQCTCGARVSEVLGRAGRALGRAALAFCGGLDPGNPPAEQTCVLAAMGIDKRVGTEGELLWDDEDDQPYYRDL